MFGYPQNVASILTTRPRLAHFISFCSVSSAVRVDYDATADTAVAHQQTQSACVNKGGIFGGVGSNCDDGNYNGVADICDDGACCIGATCTVEAPFFCSSQGGSFKGEGVTCDDCNGNALPDACETTGLHPCCLPPEGPCVLWTAQCCSQVGGEFFPDKHKCLQVECGIITSAPTQPPPEP